MKVLLKQTIDSLGQMGEVVEVARGYARNYLIPRGLAVGLSRGRLKEVGEQRKVLEVKGARERETFEELGERIRSEQIVIFAKAGEGGKLYGSVTSRDLAGRLSEIAGRDIDRKKLQMEEHIKTLGEHRAQLRLHPRVEVELEFEVVAEGEEPGARTEDEKPTEEGAPEAKAEDQGEVGEGPQEPKAEDQQVVEEGPPEVEEEDQRAIGAEGSPEPASDALISETSTEVAEDTSEPTIDIGPLDISSGSTEMAKEDEDEGPSSPERGSTGESSI